MITGMQVMWIPSAGFASPRRSRTSRGGFLQRSLCGLVLAGLLGLLAPPTTSAAAPSVRTLQRKALAYYKARKYDEAVEQLEQLFEIGGSDAAEALFDLGMYFEIPRLYESTGKMLAEMVDEETLPVFEKESRSRDPRRAVFVCDILRKSQSDRAPSVVANLLESRHTNVVRAAIAALEAMRHRDGIPALLGLLEKFEQAGLKNLITHEVRDALFALTGQDFEAIADWKKWWATAGETFDPRAEDTGKTRVRRQPREKAPEFAGKKIFAKNVVFVIDNSGSMQYVIKDDIPGLTWSDGSDSGRVVEGPKETLTEENRRLAKFWSRMETAKRELLRALKDFDGDARINVVSFNRIVRIFEKRMRRYTEKVKAVTMSRVESLTHVTAMGTNTFDALETAFHCDPRITEIYFLSDGLPSKDGLKNDDPFELMEQIEGLNRFRKIKIHTFGFDPTSLRGAEPYSDLEHANKFLEELAERTGGTFTLLKVTDEKPPKNYR